MTRIIRPSKTLVLAAAMIGLIVAVPPESRAAAGPQDLPSAVQAKLNKSQFKDVKVSADATGIVTLTGSVSLYEYKSDAEKNALHVKGIKAVRNLISVAGPTVSDADLEKKLGEQLTYNREGYGSMYDAITLQIQDGVVTLGGHSHDYPDRDSAVALAATTPGVKDVVDNIEVDPVSQMDWGIRIAVARAVYSFPSLSRYAIDPAHPIRISVQNGHVELYGLVDSQADKEAAGLRANTVPGVFSVENDLQVAGQPAEKKP
ncbi:Transport-associated protein [Candidatus Sulfotelmatomonas gaucii]|uniref:Transport-associated protein n=1 Tax=Candidatus Sulfuritelmatomonas gaucii TaxID=2043161 RepID=A0A2N9L2C1_9BACT|nr:Transport-associated protein [Candidatus Sulfotelmatomonas gaucii]